MAPDTVEVVTLRLTAIGILSKPEIRKESPADRDPGQALKGNRKVYMDGALKEVPIFDRKKLRCGNQIPSPSIVEQVDSTTVLFEGYGASVDECRNLIIERKGD
jgi:N-methylhydantoinase A/oxoprolinase/acetone carboxylase beta subunit